MIGGLSIGILADEQMSSIDNQDPDFFRCSSGCYQYPFNLFGKCCTNDLSDQVCQTIDFCKSEAKKPFSIMRVVGFLLSGLMVIICICAIFCYSRSSSSHSKTKASLLESQNPIIQPPKKKKSKKLKGTLNYCWEVDPSEDKDLNNNHELECLVCHKGILGQKIIKQKCCGVYNHKKCYSEWIKLNQTCISCKGTIVF